MKNRGKSTRVVGLLLIMALNFLLFIPNASSTSPSTLELTLIEIPKHISPPTAKQEFLDEVLDSAIKQKDFLKICKAYRTMGHLKRNEGFYHLAIYYFKKGLDIPKDKNIEYYNSFFLNEIGTSYRRLKDLKSSYKYHSRALNLAYKSNNLLMESFALNGIGNILLDSNEPQNAISYFKQSLDISTKIGNTTGRAINYANMGSANVDLGNYEQGLYYLFKSLYINKKSNNDNGIKICYTDISEVYQKMKQTDKAILYAELAIAGKKGVEPIDSSALLVRIANLYREKKDFNQSNYYALKAALVAKRIHANVFAFEAYNILKLNHFDLGNTPQYLKYYEKSLKHLDSMNSEVSHREIKDLKAANEIAQKNAKIERLIKENRIAELENSRTKNYLLIYILISTVLILIILLIVKKDKAKAKELSFYYEQKLKRSQLNPHFIYNSLNSIQKYIWNNNPEQASIYLSSFSLLMRKHLESMRQSDTILSKEIELLTLYLDLEKQRLSDGFDYEIAVDPQINTDEITIPSLISQPFIENAVWHGVAPIIHLRKGLINIKYSLVKDSLKVEIIDNGNGINQANFEKQISRKEKNHESAGIKITSERLLLNYNNIKSKRHFNITIEDLSNIASSTFGTKSTIHIPFREVY